MMVSATGSPGVIARTGKVMRGVIGAAVVGAVDSFAGSLVTVARAPEILFHTVRAGSMHPQTLAAACLLPMAPAFMAIGALAHGICAGYRRASQHGLGRALASAFEDVRWLHQRLAGPMDGALVRDLLDRALPGYLSGLEVAAAARKQVGVLAEAVRARGSARVSTEGDRVRIGGSTLKRRAPTA